jgi:hypothetical protein
MLEPRTDLNMIHIVVIEVEKNQSLGGVGEENESGHHSS